MRRLLNLFLIHFYLQSSQKLPSTPLLHLPINQCQDFWWTLQLSGSQHDLWSPWSALPSRVHIAWKTQSEFALHLARKLSFHWLEGKLTSVENRRLKNDGDGVGEEEEEEISWDPSEVEGGTLKEEMHLSSLLKGKELGMILGVFGNPMRWRMSGGEESFGKPFKMMIVHL